MEEWKLINEYPNYSISSLGQVKNNKTGIIKTNYIGNRGYIKFDLYKKNERKHFSAHHLVALHFLPNWNNYKEIDHRNRNKLDNRVINLRWCSRSENCKNKAKKEGCSSKYVGIDLTKWGWRVRINNKHIGYFNTEENAYLAI